MTHIMLHRFDLIILDLMLSQGVSGYDIFRRIRALAEFDAIPIVAAIWLRGFGIANPYSSS
ncbi:MAG: hypothetical protein SGJ24_17450 [Chloroflexota bacterium]|mgnify:CR=1 FL=1|nr:hypothetical protein [Chloroflexota bacterium]